MWIESLRWVEVTSCLIRVKIMLFNPKSGLLKHDYGVLVCVVCIGALTCHDTLSSGLSQLFWYPY